MKFINYFFSSIVFVSLIIFTSCQSTDSETKIQPNIIYIYTDQQSANMMSCAGNEWLKTPAMDYIAENGIRFTRAYTTNPVCSPARVSLMTGRFPGYFKDNQGEKVRENVGSMRIPEISEEVRQSTIAAYADKAGYELVYGGKEHLPRSLTPAALGFIDISDDERDELVDKSIEYIKNGSTKPYFMVISLINPHDICYMAIRDFAVSEHEQRLIKNGVTEIATLDKAMQIPDGISEEEFYNSICPPLPPNFEPQLDEPEAIKLMLDTRAFRKNARDHYQEKDWRMHRWAYCRLTEVVDAQIQKILMAIQETGQEEKTLILFSSDHGDMDGAHRMEHKSTLYEESANIPFLAMWKGHIPKGQTNTTSLISNGLDLLPTVADYMGVEGKADPRGRSLRPLFEGNTSGWRENLGVESMIGNMVVQQDGLKYILYDMGTKEEQALDLKSDPFETRHFTNDPEYATKIEELRSAYDYWFAKK
jgi:choline-sulfatase